MELHFEKLKIEHLDDVVDIENRSFKQPWIRGMFEREICLSISKFFIAKNDNNIVGYGGYWWVADEAHLVNLAVHPDFRRQGIAGRIIDHIMPIMRGQGITKILLEVRRSNLSALALYEKIGFRNNGIRKNYYVDEDAILMEKILDPVRDTEA
ncbi:MAG: ribosomal protein S18-alanine N-acetyltransferase [Elusimicrobiota bacterium]